MVLDKSPELILDNNFVCIQNEFEQKIPSIVLCLEAFHKTEFIKKLMDSVKNPIIFVDMDLLFTGYVNAGMIQKNKHDNFSPKQSKLERKIIRNYY